MVRSAFHLSPELQACNTRFKGKDEFKVFAFPCAFTKQFLGRRDPKGFGWPVEEYHRDEWPWWWVRAGYGPEHDYPATWVVKRGDEEYLVPNELPLGSGFAGLIYTRNWAYVTSVTIEGALELWRFDIETLKWRSVKLMKREKLTITGSSLWVEMGMEKWRVVGICEGSLQLAVWDEELSPRLLNYYGTAGLPQQILLATRDVVVLVTIKGETDEVGEFVLFYIGSDKPPHTIGKLWWISDGRIGMDDRFCGDVIELHQELSNYPIHQPFLEF